MKILHLSSGYLDVRAGRLALALKEHGIISDGICFRYPPQFRYAWDSLHVSAMQDYRDIINSIKASDADVIHVHGELYGFYMAQIAREATDRPVVLDIHDLACARQHSLFDPHEMPAYDAADAYVWVTPEQRDFGAAMGLVNQDKPEVFITNYISSSCFIEKTPLPHVGGVIYAGGVNKRGDLGQERDLSAVSDALDGQLNILCGSPEPPDYGIMRGQEVDYQLLIHRLAQYDWGFCGYPTPVASWTQAMPTKVTEYFAAGLPVIFLNVPICKQFAEMGMGVYCETVKDVEAASRLSPKPFKKAVMAQRSQFCVERIIEPLVEMYRGLL